MKSTTKIQLVIQQHLEEQLAGIYALDQQLDGINPSSDAELESLEAQLRESIRNQSLNLAKHIARNEVLTKELIRLEMEQEQLQQSNVVQQQRVVALQGSVAQTRKHHQFMIDQGAKLESELEHLEQEQSTLQSHQTTLSETISDRTAQVADLEAEIAQLQMQAAHLERNITGLKELREQNLLSVMDLTSELHDVSSGKD